MTSSSSLSSKTFSSITAIGKQEWDSAYPAIAESYGFLKTAEETLSGQYKFRYIAVYENSRCVSVVPCFVLEYPLALSADGPAKHFLLFLQRIFPKLLIFKVVACGSPCCEGRIAVRDGANNEKVLREITRAMEEIAREENAPLVAFKDFSDKYAGLLAPLKGMTFHKVRSYPSVEMDLDFKTFGEYFSRLSHSTRKDLRRKFREVDGVAKIDFSVQDELGGALDDAYALYLDNFGKSDIEFEKITKEFFRDISKNMPGEVKYFLCRIDGKLVAFNLCLILNGTAVGQYIGLDYAVAYKYHLYFVLFRDRMNWLLRNGIRKYETGALNYDPKKRLDYRFVPEYIYVKHRNGAMNGIFGWATKFLSPDNFDPVLKTMSQKEKTRAKNT